MNTKKTTLKKLLIERFLKENLTRNELKNLHEEVNGNEGAFLKYIEEDWDDFQINETIEWPEKYWKKLESKISNLPTEVHSRKVVWFQPWMKVAATFIIFVSVWFVFKTQDAPTVSDDGFPAMITEINDSDDPATVMLRDGTKVILTAHSSLSYYENFNNRYRVVHLEGEAFFETDLETDRPFIVVSDNITSICRGKEFSVSAFKDSDVINITLSSGHIEVAQNDKLNSENNKVDVKSCQRYSFNKTSQKYLIGQITDCEYDEKVRSMKKASSREIVML